MKKKKAKEAAAALAAVAAAEAEKKALANARKESRKTQLKNPPPPPKPREVPKFERKNFGQLEDAIDIPNLIEIQLKSYSDFLQLDVPPEKRKSQGLQETFQEIFPASDSLDSICGLEFVSYSIGEPKVGIIDCLKDGGTYQGSLQVRFRLRRSANTREVIEETVPLGDIPLMTESGSFVINGAERVIVSQLHRSPGICFEENRHASGKHLYSFRIIADHGSWLETHFDTNDYMHIYLDRKRRRRKFLISTFLRAFGFESDRELLDAVYGVEEKTVAQLLKLEDPSHYYSADDITHPKDKETVVVSALESLNEVLLGQLKEAGVKKVPVVDTFEVGDYFIRCVEKDDTATWREAQRDIFLRMRPQDHRSYSEAGAKALFKRLFEDPRRYNLGSVGRYKINQRLGIDVDPKIRVLTRTDIAAATRYLMALRNGRGTKDDIDHLGRRRLRTVGELVQNQCRIGLMRTANQFKDRLSSQENRDKSIARLINPKPFASVIRDFFGRNQLSQFMDQTNCLAELTNKRRLSALGPGGLTRERAGYDVRDVHSSHYGRICPIETPEGPNIGLISSLALYGKVDEYGFIETPYCKVIDGKVTDQIIYLTADKEEDYIIAQANAPVDEEKKFTNEYVLSRNKGENGLFKREDVQLIDVSPKQLISAAAGLIPFLEHNDANRALMGANMQRQAVPLLKAEAALVGTGLERVVARDSKAIVCAVADGIVFSANAEEIVITKDGKEPAKDAGEEDCQRYHLYKFLRSNASTLINQRPIVRRGDIVRKGDTIADGACTDRGEIALGRNVMAAFMPWRGYNFEDAIIISERLVQEDIYTSVHVSLEEVVARDTKQGPEEITRDIPNVGEEALRNLDTEGIIRVGSEVKAGDILVGKITPKNEPDLAPEQRLLKAIFGEKAADVKDSSLVLPSGSSGIIMEVRPERKFDPTKQKMSKAEYKQKRKETENKYNSEQAAILDDMIKMLGEQLLGEKLQTPIYVMVDDELEELVPANRKITKMMLTRLANNYDNFRMKECEEKTRIEDVIKNFRSRLRDNDQCRHEAFELLEKNEGQEPGKIASVKVYIASKRRIAVGDKMAGRHGNKGIVAKIVPVADLPFMADGTPVDIILNPLGVPSRMNVGQVFETHAGWAAKILGKHLASPVFDGIREETIVRLLREAREVKVEEMGWVVQEDGRVLDQQGIDRSDCFVGDDGKTVLYDGCTGEPFDQRIVVGQIYMLKLDHLVASKIHARAVGPYSLVTQQPLGGKAQHGGQRFGEMEVWALEAYGAAYTLQEMLTVKSDDVPGRTKIYDSIMQGKNELEAGTPESFNVLMQEMKGLCLDVKIRRSKNIIA
ncbi:MAG: DNA-directed RNA polymerase subunit beta [Oligosphaeraceae bacterium]|nr:DNA-directed RNA polymerase subunit beta [Oligosphaeraceae bacterium]